MNPADRIPTLWAGLAAMACLWACGDDRVSSGTSGTQTGNALQARLLLADGRPAASARVVARSSQSIDSTDPVIETTTDSDGLFRMRLPGGDWTFEATRDGSAARMDLHLVSDTALAPDTIRPVGALEGTIQGASVGQSLSLPGLGRRVVPDSAGRFRFRGLARGTHPLRLSGSSASWSVSIAPGATDTVLLDAARSGEIFEAVPGTLEPATRSAPTLLVQSVAGIPSGSTGELEWTTSTGSVVPSLVLDRDAAAGTVRAWIRPPASGSLLCRRVVVGSARSSSPFSDHRLALVFPAASGRPDSLGTDSVLNYADSSVFTGFGATTSFGYLSGEGWYRRSPLGSPLATLAASSRPATPRWSLSLRVAQEYPDVGRIWLVDAMAGDSVSLRLGIGAGALNLVGSGVDTTISVAASGAFHDWTISSNGSTVAISLDGHILLRTSIAVSPAGWTRCGIGVGGGLRLSRLFVLDTL